MKISFAVAFGLAAGSFANVLAYRLPRERPVVTPRSHCFCCGTPLAGVDLVPLWSFLRGGRCCRYCGVALSGQYLWVELACGLLFGLLFVRFGVGLGSIAYAVAGVAMLAAFVIDLRHKIIPGVLPAVIAAVGLLASAVGTLAPAALGPVVLPSFGLSLAGMAVGYLVFETIVRLGRVIFGQEAMGGGDVLLAAALGTLLGPGRRFWAFFLLGILGGAVIGGLLLATGRLGRREGLAFGPFLIAGALAVLLLPQLGDWVAAMYALS